MSTMRALAANLRRFRLARGWTQADLAEFSDLNVQTISNYENEIRWPQADVIDILAKALKIRPWQLLAEESEGGAVPPELIDHIAAAARSCGLKVSRS